MDALSPAPALEESNPRRVLLTGATGFVGRNLWPVLRQSGCSVRCLTRNPECARRHWPEREWAGGDVGDEETLLAALAGCDAAYYLVHGMAEGKGDFRQRELASARRFLHASGTAGVRRIIYLGGMAPQGPLSEHLRSRLEVGETLRSGTVSTIELRASMIVGHGSLSWLIVRDLTARLPIMVLPGWLKSRTQPIALGDVLAGLQAALDLPLDGCECFDLPGPETLSAKEILIRISAIMSLRRPVMIEVPVLSPWLSSHWVRFVTRADWTVAREIVVGLTDDVVARDARFWELCGRRDLIPFDQAVREALREEAREAPPGGFWGAVEGWIARGSGRSVRQ